MTTPSGFLDANLAAHRARWNFSPRLPPDCAAVRIGGGERPAVALRAADGTWIPVHDGGDPAAEVERWLAQAGVTVASSPFVCVIGAGLGYVVDTLANRAPDAAVLVIEPEGALLRASLERRDWTAAIAAGRLMFLAGGDYAGRDAAWRIVTAPSRPPAVLVHPAVAACRPAQSKLAAQVLGQALSGARANAEARARFAPPYLLNTLRNLPHLAHARDVRHAVGRHAGRPAIVAGAGPSLDRNLAELTAIDGWRDRAVVIAVDTALKPMLAAGVTPHAVVAVDPGEANAATLLDLPPLPDTWLVAEPSLDPRCFAAFHGRTACFRVSDSHEPWPWLADAGVAVGRLRAWGSVLTTAYDLALELGCDPIVLIGADLAYTGGQPYCRGTVYEERWATAMAGGLTLDQVWARHRTTSELVHVDDLTGAAAESSRSLVAFRDWLVTQAGAQPARRLCNATGAGILHGPRIAQVTLADVLAASRRSDGSLSPALATAPPIATPGVLHETAVRALGAVATPPPPPLPAWTAFTAGSVTAAEVADALAAAFPAALVERPGLAPQLDARRAAAVREAAAWTARDERLAPPPAAPGTPHWRVASPGDWCFGPTAQEGLPPGPLAAFRTNHALQLNARRLEHLASLGLPLRARRVLDTGAGVGDLADFFLDRGCLVHVTEARHQQLDVLARRFARHPLASVGVLDLDPPPADTPPLFDVVICCALLHHLSDPAAALDYLARATGDLLLVDTVVGDDAADAAPVDEDPAQPGAAVSGRGSRPSRPWLWARMREVLPYVYVPRTQPNHYEYPVDWTSPSPFLRRAVFVASHRPIDSPLLSATLLEHQSRH